ncbi:MAG TPA: flagellar basal-body rod protein FlgF [Candidatus Baltobacteraceae bacterium]|jgi:flagellar basal-body rod protein FlgG|nr:flagellar basal-body rod protein FlgF [Candidatus Baltobacteraceae bacterium]
MLRAALTVRRVFHLVRGLYTAAAGALVAEAQADVIANNLANVNTAGFKRTLLQVQSAPELGVYRMQNDPAAALGGGTASTPAIQFVGALGTGSQVADTPADFEQGSLSHTGNSLDLAIQGAGFFTLQTPQGIRYTRDGQFTRDAQGYLVTLDGDRVLGRNGPIALQSGNVQIAQDGTVRQNGQSIDQLRVVSFANQQAVRPEGDNRFVDTGNARPAQDAASTVNQGFLEGSNASVVRSMVDLITAQRWFEANQKVIQTQDTTNGYAVQTVARSNGQ